MPCIFPGTGETIGTVADCDAADVDDAVKSARAAFEAGTWSRMAPQDRRRIMLRFSELILENRDDLALLETLNVGKPLVNATNGEVNIVAFSCHPGVVVELETDTDRATCSRFSRCKSNTDLQSYSDWEQLVTGRAFSYSTGYPGPFYQ